MAYSSLTNSTTTYTWDTDEFGNNASAVVKDGTLVSVMITDNNGRAVLNYAEAGALRYTRDVLTQLFTILSPEPLP